MKLTEKDFRTIHNTRLDRTGPTPEWVHESKITAAPFERGGVILWENINDWPYSGWYPIRKYWGVLLPKKFHFSDYSTNKKPCDYCGETLMTRHPNNRFCSDRCKQLKTYEHAKRRGRPSRAKTPTDIECGHCGESFTPARSDARYCSVKCRVAAHRAKSPIAE